ncbi:hypothetical protein MPER_10875 [Moniliophthora perniciosa FA553]|nr:hypothetical protein MPER_10875 [Moniliophthora perniciosa FA553]
MQKHVSLDATKPPTATQMLKLSMNKDFREAVLRAQEEFQRAGIDLMDKACCYGRAHAGHEKGLNRLIFLYMLTLVNFTMVYTAGSGWK